jgi:uncharacterized BrkB/YihY/UPF0761 family membrane protein
MNITIYGFLLILYLILFYIWKNTENKKKKNILAGVFMAYTMFLIISCNTIIQ